MTSFKSFEQKLFRLTPEEFEPLALEVFRFQANENAVYKAYLSYLNVDVENVKSVSEIPFMPISFFKTQEVKTGTWSEEISFASSGTTGQVRSQHLVRNLKYYEAISQTIFERIYGPVESYTFFALLPSYLERKGSSLIYMVDNFIKLGGEHSGFYLDNLNELIENIQKAKEDGQKIVLMGVSFALLDLAENYDIDLSDIIIMETGGMKGRRKEMIRSELHAVFKQSFGAQSIHSEYGMTELLSQAYSKGGGVFNAPTWMRVLVRDLEDPFNLNVRNRYGGINVIDLANIDSCCFIESQDLGRVNEDGSFEILGRIDNSEIRGCNLLISNL
ncbi:acyl transferase [Fulvivirga sp. RKSG066]|uniref:acyl transferase n=1 Tax=Fulvivirga aurantia TaxID=2529383 RepID=UPI0012BD209C|nr:acyl transferase [Fulvivirga aurantia]MTI22384.1 acyl transferase [Fulvivirga aurantia]